MKESIKEIRERMKQCPPQLLPDFIASIQADERAGVKKIQETAQHTFEKYNEELLRLEKMTEYERNYDQYPYICGIDEVGRGPLAGPVVAAAVILPKNCQIFYLNDSKILSEKKREELYDEIMEKAVSVGIGLVNHERIDEINILQATYEAMRLAISRLCVTPQILLNDEVTIPEVEIRQVPIIKGDGKSLSIAAASVVAKVTRDRLMKEYHQVYPEYHFEKNKGYGSAEHIKAIQTYGPCEIHRRSFLTHFI